MKKNSYKKINFQFCSTYCIPLNSFPYQKSRWKVQVNVMTPQELKMVCGESNEINGEKIILCLKNCLLLISSEKNCTFKLGSKKV